MTKLYQTLSVEEIINLAYPTVQDDPPYCHLVLRGDEYIDERTGKDCLADTESCKTCLREWLELEVIPPANPQWCSPWVYAQSTIFSPELPPDEQKVLCWTRTKKGVNNLIVGYYSPELGRWCLGANTNVIAWMPLPSDEILDDAYGYVMQNIEAGDVL